MAALLARLKGANVPLYVGGLGVLVAGVVLTISGNHQVGNTLLIAGAAELGVKVTLS